METLTVVEYTGRKFSVIVGAVVQLNDYETGALVSRMTRTYFDRQVKAGQYTIEKA